MTDLVLALFTISFRVLHHLTIPDHNNQVKVKNANPTTSTPHAFLATSAPLFVLVEIGVPVPGGFAVPLTVTDPLACLGSTTAE